MKQILFLLLIPLISLAQNDRGYEIQRKKINAMLDARSAKFGQFEASLSKRTGIFGLKTKKDMQRSIDILSDIVQTDNSILRETKVLVDYKDVEKSQAQSTVADNAARIKGYQLTINQVQKDNDTLSSRVKELEDQRGRYSIGLALLLGISVLLLILRRKKI